MAIKATEQHKSVTWAQTVLKRTNILILDTETTGLNSDDEIIDIALINLNGDIKLNTFIQCQQETISESVTAIHGITKEMLVDAPSFPDVWETLKTLVSANELIIYNAVYDLTMLRQTARRHTIELPTIHAHCLLHKASAYINEPGRHGEYRWQSLLKACAYFQIEYPGTHRALADTQATLALLKKLAETT